MEQRGMVAVEQRGMFAVIGALITCVLLGALDQTIVATALPTIVGDLGGVDQISWVITAYLLTSTVCVPLCGKISDIYGRKLLLQIMMVIFLVGSLLAAFSQSMLMLIVTRGIQGVGGGGLMAMSYTLLSDVVPARERSKYIGYFTGAYATASVIGPFVGGFIVDHLSWHWIFLVNLPLGGVAFLVAARFLHPPVSSHRRPVDVVGAVLLVGAVTCLLLVAVWGGNEHAWGSPTIVSLGLAGVVLGIAFAVQEQRAPDPIMLFRLFGTPVFRVSLGMALMLGAVLTGVTAFLPLFLQIAKGSSATSSGLLLVPMMIGMVTGSTTSGRLVSRLGRYKIFPVIGGAIATGGIVVLSTIGRDSSQLHISAGMAVLGIGAGSMMPILTLAVQNAAPPGDIGAATTSVNFFRQFGSVFGVALFGTLMTNELRSTISELLPSTELGARDDLLSKPSAIRTLPAAELDAVTTGIADGLHLVLVAGIPLVIGAWVLSWFLPEHPLHTRLASSMSVEGMEALDEIEPPPVANAPAV